MAVGKVVSAVATRAGPGAGFSDGGGGAQAQARADTLMVVGSHYDKQHGARELKEWTWRSTRLNIKTKLAKASELYYTAITPFIN